MGGVPGRPTLLGGRTFGLGGSVDKAEMPFSSTSLARPQGAAMGGRGGKESPRLSRQGVTGVLGPVRIELGVFPEKDDWPWELEVTWVMSLGCRIRHVVKV